MEEPLTDARGVTPTLGLLWGQALSMPNACRIPGPIKTLLAGLDKDAMASPLTALQREAWNKCNTGDGEDPFLSNRNLILVGPTSSGKTTLGEMLLLRPQFFNQRRPRALYIAPTRALAQARYASLKALLASSLDLQEELVLSTGEDADDDARLLRGNFRIGCLVYEKANILFSHEAAGGGGTLLSQLGCVVVDELHMLADLSRGPTLELALAKMLQAQWADDESRSLPLRIVAITTEAPSVEVVHWLRSPPSPGRANQPPIVVESQERPVPVAHFVVSNRPRDQLQPGTEVQIATFRGGQARSIDDTEWGRLQGLHQADLTCSCTLKEAQLIERVKSLTLWLLDRQPNGRRILIFIPSKYGAQELAKNLASKISAKLRKRREKVQYIPADDRSESDRAFLNQFAENGDDYILINREHWEGVRQASEEAPESADGDPVQGDERSGLAQILTEAESTPINRALWECAMRGVFFHHADVDKPIRAEIERITGERLAADAPSQVLVATETLSYGVNLAVHDVILASTMFYTETRGGDVNRELLSPCNFHNMVGRAGRLGKIDILNDLARVYIVPGSEQCARDIIARYYCPQKTRSENPLDRAFPSRLFHQVDQDAMDATELSHPFVRSVLDAARHESQIPSCSVMEHTLFINTITGSESEPAKDCIRNFDKARKMVIERCVADPPGLIQMVRGSPVLTDLGSAMIDTGTGIGTVIALLDAVATLELAPDIHPMPAEGWLLVLVCLDEVYRRYANYIPVVDHTKYDALEAAVRKKNSRLTLASFRGAVASLGVIPPNTLETLAGGLVAFAQGRTTPTDGALRLFSGLVAWLRLESQSTVAKCVLGYINNDGKAALVNEGNLPSFNALTEAISWKVICLAKVLENRRSTILRFDLQMQRALLGLVERLRYGCPPEAVPMFRHGRVVSRAQVKGLLEAGADASQLLAGPYLDRATLKRVQVQSQRIGRLRGAAWHHARARFSSLRLSLAGRQQTTLVEVLLKTIWDGSEALFKQSGKSFRQRDYWASGEAPNHVSQQMTQIVEAIRHLFQVQPVDGGQITTSRSVGDIGLVVNVSGGPCGAAEPLTVVIVATSVEWRFLDITGPVKGAGDLAAALLKLKRPVLVPFPWLPLAAGGKALWGLPGLVIASPMALLTALTLTARGILTPSGLSHLFAGQGDRATVVNIERLMKKFNQDELDRIGLPLIHDLLDHFEVTLSEATTSEFSAPDKSTGGKQ